MKHHLPFGPERVAVVAITRHGIAHAGRVVAALPGARLFAPGKFRAEAEAAAPGAATCFSGGTGDQVPALFAAFDGIVCVVSLGAVVRLIAPHLQGKDVDPAVVVLDEGGRFVIPVLSGHVGGANALAAQLAEKLGATPVFTTASDSRETLAVDLLGREFGWTIEAPKDNLTRAAAAVVNDAPVAIVQEAGEKHWWSRAAPLPSNLHLFESLDDVAPDAFAAVLWISRRDPAMAAVHFDRLAGKLVTYRPPPEGA
jgi:cobalt-precorrin 5A hydrolase